MYLLRYKNIFIYLLFVSFLCTPYANTYAAPAPDYKNPTKETETTRLYSFDSTKDLTQAAMYSLLTCTDLGGRAVNWLRNLAMEKVDDKLDPTAVNVGDSALKNETKKNTRLEYCLNGVAYSLSRYMLSNMTQTTINWINTGFEGNPMYLQDIDVFNESITKDTIKQTTNIFGSTLNKRLYPYGSDAASTLINSFKSGKDFEKSMITTLPAYLKKGSTINDFEKDFSVGGWDGWLALTQIPQNNPLGSSMLIYQHAADKEAKQIEQKKDELLRNGGIFDQTQCAKWSKAKEVPPNATPEEMQAMLDEYEANKTCIRYKILTPGSVIKDKLSKVLNTPETQAELADGLNETLASVFSSLLGSLYSNGLTLLGGNNNPNDFSTSSVGLGSNELVDENGDRIPSTNTRGSGFSGAFDITQDLGDLYGPPTYIGEWNAKDNIPYLKPGTGNKNDYYNVSVAGFTTLDGLSNWKVGDKVFFDGKNWKNKAPSKVLVKRGVISDQLAYIKQVTQKANAGQKIPSGSLEILPKITPAIGELDYCIPGPNPSWELHASETKSEYLNYIGGFRTEVITKEKGQLGRDLCKIFNQYGSTSFFGLAPQVDCNAPIQEFLVPPDPSGYNARFKNTSILKSNQAQEFYKLLNENIQTAWATFHNTDATMAVPGIPTKWVPLQELLNSQVSKWNYVVKNLYDDYVDSIKDTYSPMTNPDAGSQYLQMAANGMKITKDLDLYAENTAAEIADYETQVSTAKSNKIQLCLIKKQVDAIVKKANDRRNAERAARGEPLVSLSCSLPPQSTYVDPCGEVPPTDPAPPASQCSDGKDNDQDGGTDGGDASCHTDFNASNIASYDRSINDEGRGNPAPACSNGEDDDNDGKIDDNDLGCYIDGKYERNRDDEKPYIEPR